MTAAAITANDFAALYASASGGAPVVRTVRIGDIHGAVRLDPHPPRRVDARRFVAVDLTINDAPAQVFLPRALYDRTLATVFDGAPVTDFAPDVAALLLETALADELEAIEIGFGVALRITHVAAVDESDRSNAVDDDGGESLEDGLRDGGNREASNGATYDANVAMTMIRPGEPALPLMAHLSQPFLKQVVDVWCRGPDLDTWDDPNVVVSIRVGATTLTERQLATLDAGDVVVLDRTPLTAHRLMLVVHDELAAFLDISGPDNHLVSSLTSIQATQFQPYVAAGDVFRSGAAAFTVHAELARTELAISTLEAIDAGAPFDLPHGIDGPVSLFIGDMRIADARLVRADGELGLRITKVFDDG